ncbi:CAST [Mytilus edulis]|uniref:ERC2 n=1 Tax=Mytilus edulis TaxID=6550 RepID=A0A8S3QGG1_MYTED|nr:CAST [Mytilus edulis]
MKECQINGKDVNLNELNKIFEEVILMEKQGKEDCNNNSVIDVNKTEHLNPGTIQISNPNNNTIKSIKEEVSSNTNREPSTSSVAIPIIDIPDDIQAQVKDINPTNSEDKSTCLDGTGNKLPQLNIQDFVTTLDKLTTVVTNLKDKVDELEISIQANNLSNASSIQILNDRMTALAKVRMQHDQQSMNKMQDIEAEIQNVNKNLEKKVNMLQGKTQSISDKIKLYEVETIKLQKALCRRKISVTNVPQC